MIAFRAAVKGETVRGAVLRVRAGDAPPRWLRMTAIPFFVEGRHRASGGDDLSRHEAALR